MKEEKAESLTLNLAYYRTSHNYTGEEISKMFCRNELLACRQTSFIRALSGICMADTGK